MFGGYSAIIPRPRLDYPFRRLPLTHFIIFCGLHSITTEHNSRKVCIQKPDGSLHVVVLNPMSDSAKLYELVNAHLYQSGCGQITPDLWAEATDNYFSSITEESRSKFLAGIAKDIANVRRPIY